MRARKILLLILILVLLTSLFSGCTPREIEKDLATNNVKESNDNKTEVAKADDKLTEIEDTLMNQIEPIPKFNKGEKVGILIISLTNPYWANMKTQFELAGKELGVEVEVLSAPTEDDTTSQLETLDAMVAKDYDVIIFSPIEANNLIPGVLRANQSNIPIVNMGPSINKEGLEEQGGYLDGVITVNYEEQGKIAAEDMLNNIPNGGKVAIIQGLPGAAQSEGRTAGAKEVFVNTENIELISIQPGNWDRNTAYDIAKDIIQANPDLKGIFCCNDVMALAAVEAMEAEGKKDDVVIYGVDFTEEAQEAIKSGRLDGSVAYPSSVYAKAGILLGLKLSQGHKIEKPIYCPLTIVNKENIDKFDNWE